MKNTENPPNISREMIIQRFSTGVKLVSQENVHPMRYLYKGPTLSDLFSQSHFNVFLLDKNSLLIDGNEPTLELLGHNSLNEAIGKAPFESMTHECACELRANDCEVLTKKNFKIFDEDVLRQDGAIFQSLTFIFPLFEGTNEVSALFGFSVILNKQSLSMAMNHIAQFRLLDLLAPSMNIPGIEIENIYLSRREKECLQFLIRGKNTREVAQILGLSKRTVEHYLENIKNKMSVNTKSELIEKAINLLL
ncbi:transcriptional regulator LuxR [Legionella steigerwaltii]|uniref:Transcriptional regulator LuxR n=1 Tax=Legionella steigerwaltii TaxID=460 RepID=A0A378LAE3_9GAMM|nr:PAS and helix-turn-helix domain-containing protein [Legionella steigerwaltii]KTD77528.1 transcriptional regulator LuxR [Legionella steigerwaltii]STY22838.1 transcriptional regulator LuxR [Legionella steigerwaltii]